MEHELSKLITEEEKQAIDAGFLTRVTMTQEEFTKRTQICAQYPEARVMSNEEEQDMFCGLGGVGPAVAGQHERPGPSAVATFSPFSPEVVTADACGAIGAVAASVTR